MNRTYRMYLGDAVYGDWDGANVILTTEHGDPTNPSNTIVFEPQVLLNLIDFLKLILKEKIDKTLELK